MSRLARSRWAQSPGAPVTLLLLVFLLAINGAAVWGILSAGQSARAAAVEDLRLRTAAQARAVEATLATLRGDFIFLVQAPPLGNGLAALDSPDPTTRRWSRRDVDGALLLFLEAHPVVEEIVVRDPAGRPETAARRRQGAPVLVRREELPATTRPVDLAGPLLLGTWPLGGTLADQGMLEARLDTRRLLAAAAPGFPGRLRTRPPGTVPAEVPPVGSGGPASPGSTVEAAVHDPHWSPPVSWVLSAEIEPAAATRSFEALAGRYRRTVGLNVLVIALTLPLGLLAFRQVRRAARLQAENEQQARVRGLERQVQHSERLASIGRLAAGMAHEINNPLEGMANYLTLLEEDLRAGRTEDALDLAGRVREGLTRAAGITRKVLAFSRPAPATEELGLDALQGMGEAPGALEESDPEVDLGEVLSGAVDFVRSNPAFRPVEVSLAAPGPGLVVAGNPTTLGQLFLNLLLNACQAQPGGGRVEVSSRAAAGRVLVAVEDHGPGIPPEVADRLFEPFVSTRGSTGLGLAVCHGIVREHGGHLRAANRPGGGARFEVELPLAVRGAA